MDTPPVFLYPAFVPGPRAPKATFWYRNYRGEEATRHVLPRYIFWGSTDNHPEPQWFLRAHCLDRNADRDFALKNIRDWKAGE